MVEENNGPMKAKKKNYFFLFNKQQATKYNCVKKSPEGVRAAFCTKCANDFGIGYGGENATKRHLETPKHKSSITSLKSSGSITDQQSSTATNKLDEKVMRAELLFSVLKNCSKIHMQEN